MGSSRRSKSKKLCIFCCKAITFYLTRRACDFQWPPFRQGRHVLNKSSSFGAVSRKSLHRQICKKVQMPNHFISFCFFWGATGEGALQRGPRGGPRASHRRVSSRPRYRRAPSTIQFAEEVTSPVDGVSGTICKHIRCYLRGATGNPYSLCALYSWPLWSLCGMLYSS